MTKAHGGSRHPASGPSVRVALLAFALGAMGTTMTVDRVGSSDPSRTTTGATPPTPSTTPAGWPRPSADGCLPPRPVTELSPHFGPGVGTGPVFAVAGDGGRLTAAADGEGGWRPVKVLWVADRSFRETVTIRGIGPTGEPSGVMSMVTGWADATERVIDWAQVRTSRHSGWKEVPSGWTVPRPGCFAWAVEWPSGRQTIWYEIVASHDEVPCCRTDGPSLRPSPGEASRQRA